MARTAFLGPISRSPPSSSSPDSSELSHPEPLPSRRRSLAPLAGGGPPLDLRRGAMSTPQVSGATAASEEDEGGSSDGGNRRVYEYSGWVYHLGVNSIGHEYCHLRFLWLRGNYVAMYKRDPHKSPGIKPIRKGAIGHTLMVEELGRRKVNGGDLYVLKLYNRLDESKKGEIACASIGDARKWMEAFDQAKQQVEYDLSKGDGRNRLVVEDEVNFEGRRPHVRRYAHGLRKLIRIGKGPEALLRQSSNLGSSVRTDAYFEDGGDAVESHTWKCVHIVNGIRIFEALGNSKGCKHCLVKAVGVIDASVDAVFEVILSVEKHKRYEWDVLTSDLEVVDEVNGHYDVVYGTYDPKYLSRWRAKTDFVFSRQWLRGQDGAYTVLQFPAVHKNCPRKSGYYRKKILPSIWEIRRLNVLEHSSSARCLVTQMLEIRPSWWDRWKKNYRSEFEKTIPFALLNQVAALRDYFRANPSLALDSPSASGHSSISETSTPSPEFDDLDVKDEFYDAIAGNESQDEDSDGLDFEAPKRGSMKLRNVSWAIASLALKRTKVSVANMELDAGASPITIDLNQFHGSLHQANSENDTNCWASPSGQGFMIRGKTYLNDYSKVKGGDPLLKLIAVDWLKSDKNIDKIALHPKCLVQSDAAKKLPFILVINLQIPAKPNYSLVMYYASEKPVGKESLLGRFVDGSDMFRDSRFKLIPSIVEGYWMVKRAVGTKACLLGKAVTCRYLRQDNFLEIDVDIGSSSVARSIIGLVLGYVTSIVVDLAILIEAKEEQELPEYILGTVRINRINPDDAIPF